MDYKEKYEETLRKAKEYYANVPGSREFLDNIFPQLSESEDEKIRKEIIDYFYGCIKRNSKSGFRVEQIKGWIAYLEKQKDSFDTRFDTREPRDNWEYIKEFCDKFGRIPKDMDELDVLVSYVMDKKQKEQKPIKAPYIPKFRKGDTVVSTKNPRLTYQILGVGNIKELGNPEYKVEIFTDGKSDEPRNIKYIEVAKMDDWGKLIEQNPAECLKPEKNCWYVCIKDFYAGGKKQSSKGDLVQAKGGMYIMGRDDISEWFRKAYYDEIKSAEWSDEYCEEGLHTRFAIYTYKNEDGVLYLSNVFVEEASRNKGFGTKILQATEKVAETIGAITIRLKVKRNSPANDWYRKRGYKYLTVEGEYDWLEKNLEYMKPSKPAEWSEEDRKTLDGVIYWLQRYFGKHTLDIDAEDSPMSLMTALKRIESLRPQHYWKPSESQMFALDNAILMAYNLKRGGDKEELQSLYNDLKKL